MFPDGAREGLYHTADATLWFFHAVQRYREATGDADTRPPAAAQARRRRRASPAGHAVRHRRRSEPTACCGRVQQGYQLTWMDAKVDDWVVTPRRGKAVEINALWYNALRLLDGVDADATAACRRPRSRQPRRAGPRVVQPALLVRRRRLSVRRRRRRSRRRCRRAGPIRCWRSRSTIRCSIASAGSRC